jgi:nitrate/TMAO reductase-like tetraheme cytochrome c subunit
VALVTNEYIDACALVTTAEAAEALGVATRWPSKFVPTISYPQRGRAQSMPGASHHRPVRGSLPPLPLTCLLALLVCVVPLTAQEAAARAGAPGDSALARGVDRIRALPPGALTHAIPQDVAAPLARLAHVQAFEEEARFPSANTCATCHPDHYREWSVSQHAYAQLSPAFNAMHGVIRKRTQGTNGDFCIRCHTPVGMNLGEPEFMSNMDRHPTSREGVTCIVCHRLDRRYGKVSGRLAIVEGDIFDVVFGPRGDEELRRVIQSDEFSVNTVRGQAGRAIHVDVDELPAMTLSVFCGACHDVNLVNGFRLEEAFSEFKASPASRAGVTCQDCHMGVEPGVPSGYATAPAAIVGGRPTAPRKRTNHYFAGPDHSIIHPGLFPHNPRATELATMREWLTFDMDVGWGTEEFERNVPDGYVFPDRWRFADDRYDAREIIRANQELMAWADGQRMAVLRAGYVLGDVNVRRSDRDAIEFAVEVRNGTDGHNVPTGFDAERMVFLEVTVRDADGKVVFVSGDRDPNGDVRDGHSPYVHAGRLKKDPYLFNLQSKFITRMIRGGERDQILAVNYSPDPLPFLRPSVRSTVLLGRPIGARKHTQTIPPNTSLWPTYKVTADALRGTRGPYTAEVRLIAQMIPVNLISEIQEVGFDYYMSPREIADAVVDGALVLWERTVEIR